MERQDEIQPPARSAEVQPPVPPTEVHDGSEDEDVTFSTSDPPRGGEFPSTAVPQPTSRPHSNGPCGSTVVPAAAAAGGTSATPGRANPNGPANAKAIKPQLPPDDGDLLSALSPTSGVWDDLEALTEIYKAVAARCRQFPFVLDPLDSLAQRKFILKAAQERVAQEMETLQVLQRGQAAVAAWKQSERSAALQAAASTPYTKTSSETGSSHDPASSNHSAPPKGLVGIFGKTFEVTRMMAGTSRYQSNMANYEVMVAQFITSQAGADDAMIRWFLQLLTPESQTWAVKWSKWLTEQRTRGKVTWADFREMVDREVKGPAYRAGTQKLFDSLNFNPQSGVSFDDQVDEYLKLAMDVFELHDRTEVEEFLHRDQDVRHFLRWAGYDASNPTKASLGLEITRYRIQHLITNLMATTLGAAASGGNKDLEEDAQRRRMLHEQMDADIENSRATVPVQQLIMIGRIVVHVNRVHQPHAPFLLTGPANQATSAAGGAPVPPTHRDKQGLEQKAPPKTASERPVKAERPADKSNNKPLTDAEVTSRRLQEASSGKKPASADYVCNHCRQTGHFKTQCPKASDVEKDGYMREHLEFNKGKSTPKK